MHLTGTEPRSDKSILLIMLVQIMASRGKELTVLPCGSRDCLSSSVMAFIKSRAMAICPSNTALWEHRGQSRLLYGCHLSIAMW